MAVATSSGDFARSADLSPGQRADPFAFDPRARIGAPAAFPPGLMNRYSIRLANDPRNLVFPFYLIPGEERAALTPGHGDAGEE